MKQILKQTSLLVLAQILTRALGFFYTIYLAKSLGVADFGLFTLALAYFSILSSVADFGFNRFLVREIASDHLKTTELLCNITILRTTLTSVLFGIFAVFLYFLDNDKLRVILILLSVLALLPQSVALTFDSIFIALKKFKISALGLFLSGLFTTLIGLFFVSYGFGVTGAINALIFGQLIYAVFLIFVYYKNSGIHFSIIKLSILKKAVIGSLPYGLLGVLGLLYFRIDTIILSYLRGSFETGIYGIAYRFLEAVLFVPSAFATVLFPNMAKLHDENKIEMQKLYFKSLRLMIILGIAALLGYLFILPTVVRLYLPNYSQAVNAITILAFSIPFIFMATPGVQVLLSTDKYLKKIIFISILTVSTNVIFNLIFIPRFGFLAAAWITVFSDILSFFAFYILINTEIFNKR